MSYLKRSADEANLERLRADREGRLNGRRPLVAPHVVDAAIEAANAAGGQ